MVRRVLLYLVAFLSLAAPASLAAQASNQTLQVAPLPRDGEVLVSFKLEEPLTDEIRAAIQSGLTVKFSYKVDLLRSSAAWFDRRIASATVTASVKYDTLTRQYHYARAVDGRRDGARCGRSRRACRCADLGRAVAVRAFLRGTAPPGAITCDARVEMSAPGE